MYTKYPQFKDEIGIINKYNLITYKTTNIYNKTIGRIITKLLRGNKVYNTLTIDNIEKSKIEIMNKYKTKEIQKIIKKIGRI